MKNESHEILCYLLSNTSAGCLVVMYVLYSTQKLKPLPTFYVPEQLKCRMSLYRH